MRSASVINADGHLDVAVASGYLMLGNGDGTFVFGGRFERAY
jgi:hypothetical protein